MHRIYRVNVSRQRSLRQWNRNCFCISRKQGRWLDANYSVSGHVLRSTINAENRFKIQQFDWSDSAHPTARTLEFETDAKDGRAPYAVTYNGPFSEVLDIGFVRCPKQCVDSTDFFNDLTDGMPSVGTTMPIETGWDYAAEGTRVAWAGFPGISKIIAQRPQPCYFEGCVSSLILREDYHLYLLDGHNTYGVSGGPVWAIDNKRRVRVIGVVSSYHSHPINNNKPELQLPGLVHAAPVQPIRSFLENSWKAKFTSN